MRNRAEHPPRCGISLLKALQTSEKLPVFVYGAGVYAREVADYLESAAFQLDGFFVDDQFLEGPHAVRSEVHGASQLEASGYHAIVGFCGDPAKALARLAAVRLGRPGRDLLLDCRFWREFSGLTESDSMEGRFESVRSLYSDPLSKTTFSEILRVKVSKDPSALAELVRSPQYFPSDLSGFSPREDDVVVDAGAFDGDTLKYFVASIPSARCRGYHAIEADPRNFQRLESTIQKHGFSSFVRPYSVALGDHLGEVSFSSKGQTNSKQDSSGDTLVQLLTLDSLGIRPTFIKMDIEGAEMAALRGAARTIMMHRPRLAIAVYHSLSQFLEVPRFLSELVPQYRLSLRLHRPCSEEMVLYAEA